MYLTRRRAAHISRCSAKRGRFFFFFFWPSAPGMYDAGVCQICRKKSQADFSQSAKTCFQIGRGREEEVPPGRAKPGWSPGWAFLSRTGTLRPGPLDFHIAHQPTRLHDFLVRVGGVRGGGAGVAPPPRHPAWRAPKCVRRGSKCAIGCHVMAVGFLLGREVRKW
jgi:hypothetical protein